MELGADVNFERYATKNVFKKIKGDDQDDKRSDVLRKAAMSSEVGMVQLLSSKADQASLDEGLGSAIERGDLEITKVILQYGGNPEELHEQFLAKVEEVKEDLVELLMRGPKRPCLECRAKGLVTAVETGSLRNATALLLNEADADYQQATALQMAVRSGRIDLLVALTTGMKPPSPASLDKAVLIAYTEATHDMEKKFALIEICLSGGARGDGTAETLLKAVEEHHTALIELLLAYDASVDYKGGAVIRHAILEGQHPLLTQLLAKKPSLLSLSNAIEATMTVNDLSAMYEVIEQLLTAGANGTAVDQALISAVELSPEPQTFKLIQLFLGKGSADVNFEVGKALQLVAAAGRIDVLDEILQSNPVVDSLNAAFPYAMGIEDTTIKLAVVEKLLQAGAIGQVVDQALVTAAKLGEDGIPLVSLLLRKASVDFENGKAICEAIAAREFEMVQTIVTIKPALATLTAAWVVADVVDDDEFRFKIFQILLELGMEGDPVARALVIAATKGTPALELCKLLLKYGASADYNNGEPLVSAVQCGSIDVLQLLLTVNPAKPSLAQALATAQALSGDFRLAAVATILKAGVAQHVCDAGLLQAAQEQPTDSQLIQLFLDANASPDYLDGSSVLHAANTVDVGLLKQLSPSINSKDVASRAFGIVFQSGDTWRTAKGLAFVEVLVQKGAAGEDINKAALQAALMFDIDALELIAQSVSPKSVFTTALAQVTGSRYDWVSAEGLTVVQFLLENGAAEAGTDVYTVLNKAASMFNYEALQLVSTAVTSAEAYTTAFNAALGVGDAWLLPQNFEVIELLLEHGAGGEMLHVGLLQALDAYGAGTVPAILIDLFLHYKADVNYGMGEAVQLAASSGNSALLKTLLTYGATQESVSLAFSMAIASNPKEKQLFELLDVFAQNGIKPDPNFVYPGMESPLILSLELYPQSAAVAERMCALKCNLEAEAQCQTYDEGMLEPEMGSALIWALCTDVIRVLVEAKGE
jgi:hypothetical protein